MWQQPTARQAVGGILPEQPAGRQLGFLFLPDLKSACTRVLNPMFNVSLWPAGVTHSWHPVQHFPLCITGPLPKSQSVHAIRAEDTHLFSDAQLKQEEAEIQEQWTGRLGTRFNTMLSWLNR